MTKKIEKLLNEIDELEKTLNTEVVNVKTLITVMLKALELKERGLKSTDIKFCTVVEV